MNKPPAGDAPADVSLVIAAREGDRAAFGGLYALYARMVHGILLTKVPPGDVDDLVQDVFLKAMPKVGDLREATRFGPWLATITRNCANDYHRQIKPEAAVTESLSDEESKEPASNEKPNAEAAVILECVRSLPEAYRETLMLRLVEGMTGPEIAARTGLTQGSVRVNLHRGMQQLREKLGQTAIGRSASGSGSERDSSGEDQAALRKRNEL